MNNNLIYHHKYKCKYHQKIISNITTNIIANITTNIIAYITTNITTYITTNIIANITTNISANITKNIVSNITTKMITDILNTNAGNILQSAPSEMQTMFDKERVCQNFLNPTTNMTQISTDIRFCLAWKLFFKSKTQNSMLCLNHPSAKICRQITVVCFFDLPFLQIPRNNSKTPKKYDFIFFLQYFNVPSLAFKCLCRNSKIYLSGP